MKFDETGKVFSLILKQINHLSYDIRRWLSLFDPVFLSWRSWPVLISALNFDPI